MNPVKLSAVIITFNEEKNIQRCVESIQEVADEIIVVDSFSTDQTLSILDKKGVKAVQLQWMGYSETKNFAHTLTSGDFILSIDADEELSPELIQSIQQFKENATADACELNRLTNYCGQWIRHSGWYPEYKTRIFRRGLADWKGSIHEELLFTKAHTTIRLKGDLYHYSFTTIESHLKKIMSYAALAAEKDFRKGKKYNLMLHGVIKPYFTFIRKYFFNAGFMDGFYGFVIAVNTAYERFLRYVKFRSLRK